MYAGIKLTKQSTDIKESLKTVHPNLKSVDNGKRVHENNGALVQSKQAKNPAHTKNWHEYKQALDSSS